MKSDNMEGSTNAQIDTGVPVGTIISYIGTNTPSGWLLCDGSTFSSSTYPELYSVLGSTTLPKLTDNRFLEGYTTPKQTKDAGLPNITGSFNGQSNKYGGSWGTKGWGAFGSIYDRRGRMNNGEDNEQYGFDFDASRSSSIYGNSSTVQPKSYTVRFLIKALGGGCLRKLKTFLNTLKAPSFFCIEGGY